MTIDWRNETASHFKSHAINHLFPLYPWFLKDLENTIGKKAAGLKILDIGCGPGFMLDIFLKASAKQVVGLDLSSDMLSSAKALTESENMLLVQADSTSLPFCSSKFDIVFSRGSIFFWKDIESAFSSIFRVLVPSGTAFLGGGYGISTPQEIVEQCSKHKISSNSNSSIPKIEPEKLKEVAQKIGGHTKILSVPKRGFWLAWTKD